MARWVFVLSRYSITFSVIPIVDTVIRFGLHAYAYGAVMISIAWITLSRLSIGSPMPMNTMFVSSGYSGTERI